MKKYTASALLLFAIAACTPSPTQNTQPVSSFVLPANAIAGQATVFSSSATDADGDVLTQTWSFGDGVRAGGSSIAHQFDQAGTYAITLTVQDAKGASNSSSQNLQVAAGAPTGTPISVEARVRDGAGTPLAGVEIRLRQTLLGTTSATGNVSVSVPTAAILSLRLNKSGYAEGIVALEYPSGSNTSNAYFESTMLPRAAAQALNASTGGSLAGTDGAALQLPPNALERSDGTPVSGTVNVSLTPLDVTQNAGLRAFPGAFAGLEPNGNRTGIVSLGTTEFALEQGGERLNLRPGSSAVVRLPMYANSDLGGVVYTPGSTVPLWSLDERTGVWVQEGTGTVVSTATGLALEARVGHFSWWNADIGFTPSNPKPKCINDTPGQYDNIFAQAVYCKFLAEIDKPIPPQGSSLQIQATTPRLPAYGATTDLPIGGNTALSVPAGVNIRYTGCIAGGAFCGSVVRNFVADSSEAFEIRLKRTDTEEIVLPLDTIRNINSIKRFAFDSSNNPNGVLITLERSAGSSFTGTAFLLDPTGNEISSKAIGSTPQILEQQLFTSGKHILEIRPSVGSSGAVSIRIERKNFVPTSNWTTLFQSTDSIENSLNLVVNNSGHGAAFWVQNNNGAPAFYTLSSSTFNATNNTWDASQVIDTQSNNRPNVALGVGGNSDKIMIWSQQTAINTMRWSRREANSNTWSAAATLATVSAGKTVINPQIRIDAAGNAVALWLEFAGASGNIMRMARFTASNTTWVTETISSGSFPETPVLALDAAGNVAVLYFDFSLSIGYYVKRNVAGIWSSASKVFTPSAAPNGFTATQFELASNGNGMAIWDDAGTLRARAYEFGTDTWKPVQNFAGTNAKIGLDSSGNSSLVYREFAGSAALFARRYTSTTDTWSNTEVLANNSNGGVIGLENNAAFNPSGDAVALFVKAQETFLTSRAASASAWTTPITDGAFETRRIALDDAGRAVILRLGYNPTLAKFEVQAKRISLR